MLIRFSENINDLLTKENLNANLNFAIEYFDNYNLDYEIICVFKETNMIECEIVSEEKLYLESIINVNFLNLNEFVSDE